MSIVAVYNLKGGVGKTTTAVNLSYLAAAAGRRTLLWDLDPQGASSFAFRIQPNVAGFGRKSLEGGQLATAIKGTDFDGLDLLPADFAYRKLDRLLDDVGKPHRVMADLLRALGRNYDVILLDCPPGFSVLIEAVFATSDLIVVPTIPTVLSLRTLARLIKWADRGDRLPALAAFLSMVDRRKTIHRRACQWATLHPQIFLAGQIPYASVVEQMAVRRMPLPAFAPGDPAALAFRSIWTELQERLDLRGTTANSAAGTSIAADPVDRGADCRVRFARGRFVSRDEVGAQRHAVRPQLRYGPPRPAAVRVRARVARAVGHLHPCSFAVGCGSCRRARRRGDMRAGSGRCAVGDADSFRRAVAARGARTKAGTPDAAAGRASAHRRQRPRPSTREFVSDDQRDPGGLRWPFPAFTASRPR